MAAVREPLFRVAWLFYLLLAVAGVAWVGLRQGRIPMHYFVDPATWALDLGVGLAAGAALLAVWELGRRTLDAARELEERVGEVLGQMDAAEAVSLALISGFAEELFFRGAMQDAWGWVVATAVFAVVHSGPGRAFRTWTAFAAVAGLTLAGLKLWRGALLAPVAAHVLVNAVNLMRIAAAGRERRSGPPEPPGEGDRAED